MTGTSDADDAIKMQSTVVVAVDAVDTLRFSPLPALVEKTLTFGSSSEYGDLLRRRLRAAAGFLAVAYLFFYAFALATPGSGYDLLGTSFALRGLLAWGVFTLLCTALPLTYQQLRWLEVSFFCLSAALLIGSNYFVHMELIERGDLVTRVAVGKNSVLRLWMLIIIYGVFIPNHPKRTALVVLAMVACALIVKGLVLKAHFDIADFETYKALTLNAGSNILSLICGAILAIYSSYVLNGLRSELHEAKKLGRYKLLRKLEAGGMGQVYLAEHQLLKRPCAIKLISSEMERDQTAIARFEREVKAAAMLSHPNTIEIYDYGVADDGTLYYVMEFLSGLSIASFVRQNGLVPHGRAVFLIRQVCGSLTEAHRMGLVHRDIKPGNIFIATLGGQGDVAKVLDFGLVKQEQPADGRQLTGEFSVSGTPAYMSPEQARGDRHLDGRSDIYALGAVLYFMLTGKPPFERDTSMAIMIAHVSERVRPLRELAADVPADLEAVILRCLSKSPADRYADTSALSEALRACECSAGWDQTEADQWWLARTPATKPQADMLAPVV